MAQARVPTQDLYLEVGARQSEIRRSHKLNDHPCSLLDMDEIPSRIQGWLTHLGWIR